MDEMLRFYTSESLPAMPGGRKLGPNMAWQKTTGFLICYNVPIARTGTQLYGKGETPVQPDESGVVRVERNAEEVFDPESIASLNAVPIADEHPPVDFNPDNWKDLSKGIVIDPHRGEGIEDDVLLATMIIMDRNTIDEVLDGKREVSGGYDSRYATTSIGRGRQYHIRFNHVALVERGRCGPRCSIRDSATTATEEQDMKSPTTVHALIKKAWRTGDCAVLDKALKAVKDEAVEEPEGIEKKETKDGEGAGFVSREEHEKLRGDHEALASKVTDCMSRLATHDSMLEEMGKKDDTQDGETEEEKKKLEEEKKAKDAESEEKKEEKETEDAIKMELPEGAVGDVRKVKDSALLQDAWQEVIAMSEIIAPGIPIKTLDSRQEPKVTVHAMCNMRRKALILGTHDSGTRQVMEMVVGSGRTVDAASITKMTCAGVRGLFNATGAAKKLVNSSKTRDSIGSYHAEHGTGGGTGVVAGSVRSIADINKKNREAFSGK